MMRDHCYIISHLRRGNEIVRSRALNLTVRSISLVNHIVSPVEEHGDDTFLTHARLKSRTEMVLRKKFLQTVLFRFRSRQLYDKIKK